VRPVVHASIHGTQPTNSSLILVLKEINFLLMNLNTYLLNYFKDNIIYKAVKDSLVFCLTHQVDLLVYKLI
jgi:hypothetical protein